MQALIVYKQKLDSLIGLEKGVTCRSRDWLLARFNWKGGLHNI